MATKMRMVMSLPTSTATLNGWLRLSASSGRFSIERIASYLSAIAGGAFSGSIKCATGAVSATGTVTFSSIVATDTVTIGATVFTGSDTSTGTSQFRTGGTDTTAATSLAAVINLNTTTNKLVTATSSLGVVTITCQVPGLLGNFFPIAISAHGSVSGSGKLTSGAEDANITVANGY